jgi:hypothetical protein
MNVHPPPCTFLPCHNMWGSGIPSEASAGQWETEERRGPHRDWLDVPDQTGDVG